MKAFDQVGGYTAEEQDKAGPWVSAASMNASGERLISPWEKQHG